MRNPTSDFRFGVLRYSNYEASFRKTKVDALRRMWHFMKPYNVESTADGVERVKNGWVSQSAHDVKTRFLGVAYAF